MCCFESEWVWNRTPARNKQSANCVSICGAQLFRSLWLLWMFCWLVALHSAASYGSVVVPKNDAEGFLEAIEQRQVGQAPLQDGNDARWPYDKRGQLPETEGWGEIVKNGRWSELWQECWSGPMASLSSLIRRGRNKVTWSIHQLSQRFYFFLYRPSSNGSPAGF